MKPNRLNRISILMLSLLSVVWFSFVYSQDDPDDLEGIEDTDSATRSEETGCNNPKDTET